MAEVTNTGLKIHLGTPEARQLAEALGKNEAELDVWMGDEKDNVIDLTKSFFYQGNMKSVTEAQPCSKKLLFCVTENGTSACEVVSPATRTSYFERTLILYADSHNQLKTMDSPTIRARDLTKRILDRAVPKTVYDAFKSGLKPEVLQEIQISNNLRNRWNSFNK
jgi:hypothetical protein